MKFKIQYKKNIPKGFIGMNSRAARSRHVPFNHNEHTIEIKKGLPKKVRLNTIHHEEFEHYRMKKGDTYHEAHKKALKFEKLNVPFPTERIREKLKQMGVLKR